MVTIQLLGGVTATTHRGVPVDVGAVKCRVLLVTLALSPGEPVTVARLIDVLWPHQPPRTAEKTLQGYIADLRSRLGHHLITRVGRGYRLDVAAEAIDVHRFRRQLGADQVEAALLEWSGPPWAGVEAPGLQAAADGLVEQWLDALERNLRRTVATDPQAAVATLTPLTAEHPSREELWALLMTALYRSGRQADALAAYQRVRRHLVKDLGVEPGPRLREVERLVLEHSSRLVAEAAGGEDSGTVRVNNGFGRHRELPAATSRLFGRDEDLATVTEYLQASAIVTVVGPGGIGKTALAWEAARRWQAEHHRRVWPVELGELTRSSGVPRAVAETLGVIEGSAATLTDSIVAVLHSYPTLLVLDNCEHVIDDVAALVARIAARAPDTRVLATSRQRVGVAAEQVLALGPLDPDGAGRDLFVERARRFATPRDLEDGGGTIAEICRRLDGIPLAIELAAARTSSLSPAQLLARLGDRLRLLTLGSRDGAERHRTLRAAVDWSYDLLSADEQELFDRLHVFTGPFSLAAAEAVAAFGDLDTVDVVDLLGSLVERSMLVVEPGPFGRQLRLLETLQRYAAERYAAHGDPDELSQRHAQWCRDQVVEIHQLLTGPQEVEGVARLRQLWPQLRTAVDWACRSGDRAQADALVRPIAAEANLRRRAEVSDWAERILQLTPAEDEARVAYWLMWAANRHVQAADTEAYEHLIGRYGHSDHPLVAYSHAYLYDDGEQGYTSSRRAVEWLRSYAENHAANLVEVAGVGGNLIGLGRFEELEALAANMECRHRDGGAATMLYFALGLRGYAAQFQGRHHQARRHFVESSCIAVPEGTFLVNRTVEARTAFDSGKHAHGLRMLLEHVDDVLATDYVDVVRLVALEFVYMMAALGHLREAATILRFLDTVGRFGTVARETLLADAVRAIAGAPEVIDDENVLDARGSLFYMRSVLTGLTAPS